MQTNYSSQWGLSHPRVLAAFALCSAGVLLAMFSFAGTAPAGSKAIGLTSAKPNMAGSNAPVPELAMGSWGVVASPNTSIPRTLDAVTCTAVADCWAVGFSRSDAGIDQTLVEHWNGTNWAVFNSPNSSAAQNNLLHGVTCNSSTDCWAVGHFVSTGGFQQTVIERWDGTSWTIATSANTSASQDNNLQSVVCTGPSTCRAVGYFTNAGGFQQTLIERWNGTNWAIAASPNTSATQHNVLKSLTCVSGTLCRAVGYYVTSGGFQQTLTERWNGTNWAIVASPNTSATRDNALQSVVCTNANNCRAVGYSTNANDLKQTLVQHWNGTDWSIIPSPNAPSSDNDDLTGVACTSGANCWAVGSFHDNSGFDRPLTEHWDGTTWSFFNSAELLANYLNSVTCPSATECWAVGYRYNSSSHQQTLIVRWDGNVWTIVDSPNTSDTENDYLLGVACSSGSDCWAVGGIFTSTTQPLLQHWDGTAWSIVASPPLKANGSFQGVACASANQCWAVGSAIGGEIIAQWDGNSWVFVATPQVGTLSRVTCTSTTDCWAVGNRFIGSANQTLTEHWDGKAWSVVDSPNALSLGQPVDNFLKDVTCVSAGDCWSAGFYANQGINQTLIEHWDGTAWAIVPSPNTNPARNNYLYGVTCVLDDYCWAVGQSFDGTVYSTLTEQWDGYSWSLISSPNANTRSNYLYGVACSSLSDCWAVGNFDDNSTGPLIPQTLIERFALIQPLFRSAVSRMTHGDTDFDIDMPTVGTPGVECRSNSFAVGEYTLIFTFAPTLLSVESAAVSSGTGNVASSEIDSKDAHNYVVHLIGVTNQQTITVTLGSVYDSAGRVSAAVSASMALLLGDVTGNRTVNSTDVSQTQFESGHPVTNDNFRADVTANGTINSSDVSTVQAQSGTGL